MRRGWIDGWMEVGCVSKGVGYLAVSESQLHSESESRQSAQNNLLLAVASRNQHSVSEKKKHHNSWEAVGLNLKAGMKHCCVDYYGSDSQGFKSPKCLPTQLLQPSSQLETFQLSHRVD